MGVPLQYFQVVAAAIPTFLIAIAVGAKGGERYGLLIQNAKTKWRRRWHTFAIGLVAFIITGGEILALIALATGSDSFRIANWCFTAVVTCIFTILLELLSPVLSKLPRAEELIVFAVFIVLLVGSSVMFGILTTPPPDPPSP